MMLELATLEKAICEALCAEVQIVPRPNGVFAVSTPLAFPDGDGLPIFIRSLPTGGLEFTDMGNSLMRLSYEMSPTAIREGTRGRVLGHVLAEFGLEDRSGELVMKVAGTEIGATVFRFSQALTRVHDLSFLKRVNVETTFYEDLEETLASITGRDHVHRDYAVPGLDKAADYPVDYYIDGGTSPLYVFGVPGRDKARLATIVLQHFLSNDLTFDSAVVFKDADEIPRPDFKRLANVANDLVMSADAVEDIARKVKHRVAAGN
jgi:hypothetical protein